MSSLLPRDSSKALSPSAAVPTALPSHTLLDELPAESATSVTFTQVGNAPTSTMSPFSPAPTDLSPILSAPDSTIQDQGAANVMSSHHSNYSFLDKSGLLIGVLLGGLGIICLSVTILYFITARRRRQRSNRIKVVSGLDFGSAEATHVDLVKFDSQLYDTEATEVVEKDLSMQSDNQSTWSVDANVEDQTTNRESNYSIERLHRELYPVQSPFSEYSVKAHHPLAKGRLTGIFV